MNNAEKIRLNPDADRNAIIDYVLVYKLDKKEDILDAEKDDDLFDSRVSRRQSRAKKQTSTQKRIEYRKNFIKNLKLRGLIIKKVYFD